MTYPLTWHLLLGTEPRVRKVTEAERKRAERRLKEIGHPRWPDVEGIAERRRLLEILKSK